MPGVSRSTFYVPLPDEPDAAEGEAIYSSVDDPPGLYARLDRGGPGGVPADYDTHLPALPSRGGEEPVYAMVVPRSHRFNPSEGPLERKDSHEPIYFELEPTPPEPPARHLTPGLHSPAGGPAVAIPGGMKAQFAALNSELAQRLAARRKD